MTVSILGCGWFGAALSKALRDQGHAVKGSTTSGDKLDSNRSHLIKLTSAEDSVYNPVFFDCDIVVIANNVRMNDEAAYLQRINFTIELIKRFNIPKVLFISSTSIYGEPGTTVDETTPPQPGTLSAKLLVQAEQLFQTASFNWTVLRFAGLIGPGRDPGRFFAGKSSIPNGLAPVNLLHVDDAVGIAVRLMTTASHHKVINAVSPDHPSRMDFYRTAAKRSGLEPPDFIATCIQWKIVNSRYTDYKYTHNLLS